MIYNSYICREPNFNLHSKDKGNKTVNEIVYKHKWISNINESLLFLNTKYNLLIPNFLFLLTVFKLQKNHRDKTPINPSETQICLKRQLLVLISSLLLQAKIKKYKKEHSGRRSQLFFLFQKAIPLINI